MANHVTNQHLYEVINNFERKITLQIARMDRRFTRRIGKIEKKVEKNTDFRNQLTGKIVVLMGIVGIGINVLWDSIMNRR